MFLSKSAIFCLVFLPPRSFPPVCLLLILSLPSLHLPASPHTLTYLSAAWSALDAVAAATAPLLQFRALGSSKLGCPSMDFKIFDQLRGAVPLIRQYFFSKLAVFNRRTPKSVSGQYHSRRGITPPPAHRSECLLQEGALPAETHAFIIKKHCFLQ